MAIETIRVPDLGGASKVEVVEIAVAAGEQVAVEDVLVVLESDKASMEIPSPLAGELRTLDVSMGDIVSEGDPLATVIVADAPGSEPHATAADRGDSLVQGGEVSSSVPAGGDRVIVVAVPDLGGADEVEIIELGVAPGDIVAKDDIYMVLESDKASMEVPVPNAGEVLEVLAALGDTVSEGDAILRLRVAAAEASHPAPEVDSPAPAQVPRAPSVELPAQVPPEAPKSPGAAVHAGPAVRKLAREFGIRLDQVRGSGPKERILKEDVQAFVKSRLQAPAGGSSRIAGGIPAIPEVDFSQFGPVRVEPMTKLHKITAINMHRSWLNVPRVTQFDDADITDLEDFRAELKSEARFKDVKVTPLPFLLKACALALVRNPAFNTSLHSDGEHIVFKNYVHIGMAVATPEGLMVPVIRDADKKSIYQLAQESVVLAQKAKDKKLAPGDMQGGCFTVSSLGSIGGTGFTPVINAPEIAILGVSRMSIKPVWDGDQFLPRKMLPLALAYDHRAVNGAEAGKFMTELVATLADIRRLLL